VFLTHGARIVAPPLHAEEQHAASRDAEHVKPEPALAPAVQVSATVGVLGDADGSLGDAIGSLGDAKSLPAAEDMDMDTTPAEAAAEAAAPPSIAPASAAPTLVE
jgi:hypothetical protein